MIYNVLLITEQLLKNNTPINDNVDTSELRFSISQAQTIFIQESLGTNLYEFILELVENGDIELPQYIHYKELLRNFIQPTLISFAYYLALDNFYLKFMNIGLVQNRSEQGNPIDIRTLTYLKTNAKNNAEFNDNLLRRHLVFNNQNFPQYTLTTNNGQLIPEFGGAFKSSMVLPSNGRFSSRNGSGLNLGSGGRHSGSNWYGCPIPWWYGGTGSGE
jgi:hypothetical protein